MDKIKRLILVNVPMSICNLRCSYCYLTHRDEYYQNKQPHYILSPQDVARALSRNRLGGTAYFNFCAEGETLLAKDIDIYVKKILEQGHYVEFVTNLTITAVLDKFLRWDAELLKRLEFKCSFHYMELKKKGFLDRFATNVKKIWAAGASVNIEITPSDEMIPYIDEIKQFSMEHFGALPQISIARNDDSTSIDYLTNLSIEEYDKIWSSFNSSFWDFKKKIFKKKRVEFCYAGDWSLYINLETGEASQCYKSRFKQNIFKNLQDPIKFKAIGKCVEAHCYNGHALLSLGCIPEFTDIRYGDIRNRIKEDGSEWLQSKLKHFFNSKLAESNEQYSVYEKVVTYISNYKFAMNAHISAIKKMKT